MYFSGRTDAGKQLAAQIAKDYAGQPCAVVALNEGGVMVGVQIALALRSVICLLLAEAIEIPSENEPIGTVSENGTFSYNQAYSNGEIDELMSDYRGYVEDEKRVELNRMHQMMGNNTGLRPELLLNKHIILVSDGLSSGYALDVASEFLKPLDVKSVVIATPIASAEAVDRMHIVGDKIYCLNVADNYLETEHYYAQHDVPRRDDVIKIVEEIMQQWHEPAGPEASATPRQTT